MSRTLVDIILPAYYEQENIEKVVKGIKKSVKNPYKITVVLQDKKDPTLIVIKKLQKTTPGLSVIFTKNGRGMLKALKEGFNRTKAPIIIVMMADLSDNPKDIDTMISRIHEGYDLVCASRYVHNGNRVGGPKVKGFLSYLACISLRVLVGMPTNDATNAFKCFRRSLLTEITIESEQGFEMPLELSVKTFKNGMKITDVPTVWRDREGGVSKFNLVRNIPYYLRWYMYAITTQKNPGNS